MQFTIKNHENDSLVHGKFIMTKDQHTWSNFWTNF